MAKPHAVPIGLRSEPHPDARPAPTATHNRRRRRPSLWDVRTLQYAPSLANENNNSVAHPHNSSNTHNNLPIPARVHHPPPRNPDASNWYIPGSNDVVRAPAVGENGPLAGINVQALRALLLGKARPSASSAHAPQHLSAAATPAIPQPQLINTPNADPSMQATRHARRLYVGNLPLDTVEEQISDFFNRALVAANGSESGDKPVISVYINLEKRFAFIETSTVREAAAGLCLDGVKFGDMFLRVRRPNDYLGPGVGGDVRPPDEFNPAVLGIVSTQVSDGPNKMFIGGIPYTLPEGQIKSLLATYGELAAFNLIKDPSTAQSKGFAFFEYVDGSVVEAAREGLHGMQVGDKTLTVRRATQTSNGSATHASGLSRANGGTTPSTVKASSLIRVSTRVVELSNIVNPDELDNDAEYKDICEDIEEEARRFGKVDQVLVPRRSDKGSVAAAVGRVFICYSTCEEAERAQATLDGRKFGDMSVSADFFDEKKLAALNL